MPSPMPELAPVTIAICPLSTRPRSLMPICQAESAPSENGDALWGELDEELLWSPLLRTHDAKRAGLSWRMTPRPWILAETSWKTVAATAYEVAVLPWGATEAHNYHLPYATDVMECDCDCGRIGAAGVGERREGGRAADGSVRREHRTARHQAVSEHESEHTGSVAARSRGARWSGQGIRSS